MIDVATICNVVLKGQISPKTGQGNGYFLEFSCWNGYEKMLMVCHQPLTLYGINNVIRYQMCVLCNQYQRPKIG